jgi:4-alpha-glucanotransferase
MITPPHHPRQAGVVLHITSLPGPHGSGDLGPEAHRFVDWLASAGQSLWQVLPLGPVGFGSSPYQSPSAFAGNPLLIGLAPLAERGWLDGAALEAPTFDARQVDFDTVNPWRIGHLRQAFAGFRARATAAESREFERWCAAQSAWLDDYALFMAIKVAQGERAWWTWPAALAAREPRALADARIALADDIGFWCWAQWVFDQQLSALRAHCGHRGVRLMGDLPIFVAHDSADCWTRRGYFHLGADHQPSIVCGVPPDGYTPDGQRWGNPMYRWDAMAADGFAWWVARLQRALAQADLVRIDHFRGFAGCWQIPASCPTARDGQWVPAPGMALFGAIERALGAGLPIVAEDLGTITPDVVALRQRFGLPGMRIVYEGFMHGPEHPFVPHHHEPLALAYTSTHDSDTVCGWWRGSTPAQRQFAATWLGLDADDAAAPVHRAIHRATLGSVAQLALAPMQDLLGLGSEHRMNRPGTGSGNWGWRVAGADLDTALATELAALARATARAPVADAAR